MTKPERGGLLKGVVLVGDFGVAGCASPRVGLTEAELKPYVALAPFDFVRQRFFDEARTPVLDSIESAGKRYAEFVAKMGTRNPATQNLVDRKPELRADLSLVTWPAYFNDVTWNSLLRPMAELRSYCRARAGEWQVVEQYIEDPVANLRRDPLAVYLDAQTRVVRSLAARNAYAGFEEVRGLIAADVGKEMAEEAAWANGRVDAQFSSEGFRYAQRLSAMGLFQCKEASGRTWWVSVMPSTLLGKDLKNSMDSSMARMAIRVFNKDL